MTSRRAITRAGLVLVLCATAAPALSQDDTPSPSRLRPWLFSDRAYHEPLTAEPHAARTFILLPGWSDALPHSLEPGSRFAWQITLGREIPIVGWETQAPSPAHMSKGRWGFGLWTPVSFHMIEDFKDESAPIVDTDYRFGSMLKAEYGLSDRTSLNLRFVPWAHESTHLGDEYTIHASRSPSFERVNVSYEYWSYSISVGHRFPASSLDPGAASRYVDGSGMITVRHGGLSLWGDDGYYSNHLLGDETPTLTPSTKNYEPSFGAELRLPVRAGRRSNEARQWLVSLDLRYLYLYRGVNPYGQLRSQNDYWSAGLGWIFR
jgi:hypothetical protein